MTSHALYRIDVFVYTSPNLRDPNLWSSCHLPMVRMNGPCFANAQMYSEEPIAHLLMAIMCTICGPSVPLFNWAIQDAFDGNVIEL